MGCRESKMLFTLSTEELFYYICVVIVMGAKGIGLTEGQKIFTLCMITAAVSWCIKMCLTSYTLKEWLIISLSMVIGGIIYLRTGEKAALAAMMFVVGMKNISLGRLMKACLGVWGITFLTAIAMGLLGIQDGVIVVHEKLGLGPIIRYSLGFTHPNVLHVSYFILVMLIIYVMRPQGKRLYWLTFFLFLGNLYIFLYSFSYTGIIIVGVYLVMCLYFDFRKKVGRVEKFLLYCVFLFSVIFPIAGPFVLKGKAFNFFNKLLSTRFELVYNLFNENSLSLFGTRMRINPDAHLTLDSSFAYLLMNYGIVAFIFFVTLYFLAVHYCISHSCLQETAVLLSVAMAGITEQFLFNLSFKNISLFIIGSILFEWILKSKTENKWNREYKILKKENKMVDVQFPASVYDFFDECKEIICTKWRFIFSGGIIFAVALVLTFGISYKTMDYILVEKHSTDYRGEDEFLIDKGTILPGDNYFSVGDISIGNGAYKFYGNILIMETLRYVISIFIWGYCSGCATIIIVWVFCVFKKSRNEINNKLQ